MFVYVFSSQEGIDPQYTQFSFASCEIVGTVGSSVNKNGNLHSPKLSKFVSLVGHKKKIFDHNKY